MLIDFAVTETCLRCAGDGYRWHRMGLPGQDPRELPNGVADVVWGPVKLVWCQVCDATGERRMRDRPQTEPRYRHWNTDFELREGPRLNYGT